MNNQITNNKIINKFYEYTEHLYSFCPYLKKAREKKLVESSFLELNGNNYTASKYLFYYSLLETEKFRKKRDTLTKDNSIYYTVNIIFDSKEHLNWEKIIEWPHYMLKYLYSSEQIMFGKFWIGEQSKSKRLGTHIPEPPVNFISIRSAVISKDPKLLEKSKQTAEIIKQSKITNNNIHKHYFEKDILTYDIDTLLNSGYYEHLMDKLAKK